MNKLKTQVVSLLFLLVILGGCATPKLGYIADKNFDLNKIARFHWRNATLTPDQFLDPLEQGKPRTALQEIERAISFELSLRGLSITDGEAVSEMEVFVYVKSTGKAFNPSYSLPKGARFAYDKLAEGTVIIDLVNLNTGELFWRGWGAPPAQNPQETAYESKWVFTILNQLENK